MGKAIDQLALSNEVTPLFRAGELQPAVDDAFFIFKHLIDRDGGKGNLTVRVIASEERAKQIVDETPGAVYRRIPFARLTEDDQGAVLNIREACAQEAAAAS